MTPDLPLSDTKPVTYSPQKRANSSPTYMTWANCLQGHARGAWLKKILDGKTRLRLEAIALQWGRRSRPQTPPQSEHAPTDQHRHGAGRGAPTGLLSAILALPWPSLSAIACV